jgi:hypothetical protein
MFNSQKYSLIITLNFISGSGHQGSSIWNSSSNNLEYYYKNNIKLRNKQKI